VQRTLSSQICPVPSPNAATPNASDPITTVNIFPVSHLYVHTHNIALL
jgi:hypothetical protein